MSTTANGSLDSFHVEKIAEILAKHTSRPALAASILTGRHTGDKSFPFSRTLLWKTVLLQIDIHQKTGLQMTTLRTFRDSYNEITTNIGIPWHLLPHDSIYYKQLTIVDDELGEDLANLNLRGNININVKQTLKRQSIKENDPLSTSNKPRKDESDLDVLLTIIGDVERLFPEHPEMFINSIDDKVRIIKVLYRYAKWINHERDSLGLKKLGYVQGMHELCGVLYAVLKVELVQNNSNNNKNSEDLSTKQKAQIEEFLSVEFFEHDLFSMFQQLMSPIIDKYFTSSGIVRESIVFDLKLHHLDLGNDKHPGLATCMKKAGIESQLWLTRWFRMILTRELGLAYSVRLWDGLIAYACVGAMADTATNGHDISALLPYVVLLLIIRIRSILLKCMSPQIADAYHRYVENSGGIDGKIGGGSISIDETEALSLLLHYPTSSELGVTLSRSVSPENSEHNDETDENEEDNNTDQTSEESGSEPPVMMYRKVRNRHKPKHGESPFKRPLEKCIMIHKLPSAVELFADAAHICGLSDSELSEVGPSLIDKYANGDIYKLMSKIEKSQPSTNNFFEEMMKTSRLWRIPSPNTAPVKSVTATPAPDGNRTRLEMKLQQRVQDRLRDRPAN